MVASPILAPAAVTVQRIPCLYTSNLDALGYTESADR